MPTQVERPQPLYMPSIAATAAESHDCCAHHDMPSQPPLLLAHRATQEARFGSYVARAAGAPVLRALNVHPVVWRRRVSDESGASITRQLRRRYQIMFLPSAPWLRRFCTICCIDEVGFCDVSGKICNNSATVRATTFVVCSFGLDASAVLIRLNEPESE